MDIKPFTPLTRMQRTALSRRTHDWQDELAEQYGVTDTEVWAALQDFLTMSLRVENLNGSLDFKLAALSDDSDSLKAKFVAYLNTQTVQPVWEIEKAIKEYDKPVDKDLAPGATSEDPE